MQIRLASHTARPSLRRAACVGKGESTDKPVINTHFTYMYVTATLIEAVSLHIYASFCVYVCVYVRVWMLHLLCMFAYV